MFIVLGALAILVVYTIAKKVLSAYTAYRTDPTGSETKKKIAGACFIFFLLEIKILIELGQSVLVSFVASSIIPSVIYYLTTRTASNSFKTKKETERNTIQ